MIASKSIQILLAGVAAVAFAGTALAQGNPPNPAVKSAPVGAGQQSTQQTPMGTTGTPTGASAATPAPSTAPMTTGSTSTGSGASMGSSSTSADTSMSNGTKTKRPVRTARADRN